MLDDVKANLDALRELADELAPGEMTQATARQMRIVAQMVTVLTEALSAVIEELEHLKRSA